MNELVIRINGSAKNFEDELKKVKNETKSLEKALSKTAKVSATVFAALTATIAGVTKQFADYETALIGVGKTTNIQGQSLQKFGKQFQALSSEIPLTTNELLGIAQAAGQLGVTGEENLLNFTRTVAKLGVSTDLAGEEAATALTRILTVTKEGVESIDEFGSVIVALGNNFAATESEIVRVTNEVARSTAVFGVSAGEAAALATSLKAVGVQAELGGSSTGRAFRAIDAAIREGGNSLKDLENLTGLAGEQLKQTFETDSVAVFQSFIEGLGEIQRSGGDTTAALEQFGLKGQEVLKVLPVLASNSELVGEALATAARETENATALNDEAARAFDSLSSETKLLFNDLTTLAVNIGSELAPTVRELIGDLRVFIKSITDGDNALASNIASFLKWGAVISGAVATISGFLLGAVKISGVITALTAAFGPAALGASAFWAAVTGPIGIAIAGLAAVAAGVAALSGAFSDEEEPKTLEEINKKIKELRRQEEQTTASATRGSTARANSLQREISKLEDLKQAKIRASEDFGTGSLLVRPEADTGVDLGASAFGIEQEQALPFRPEEVDGEDPNESFKKQQEEKTKILDAATQERIDLLRSENEKLSEIEKARLEGTVEADLELLRKKAEIDAEILEAQKIQNEEERNLAIENVKLQNAEVLAQVQEFENRKLEIAKERAEEKQRFEEAFNQLTAEQRALFDEEDLLRQQEKIQTEREVEQQIAEEDLEREIAERNRFLEREKKFGTQLAQLDRFFRSQEIQGAKEGAAELIQLTRSKNEQLKSIGKAAASVNAAIATSEGAIKAYTALAGIPIVGPALGAAAAAALIAFGVEQQGQILAANTGGLVPQAAGRNGVDSVPALLTPNELVAPTQNFDEVVEGTARSRGFVNPDEEGSSSTGGATEVILSLRDNLIDFIEAEVIERRANNTGIL